MKNSIGHSLVIRYILNNRDLRKSNYLFLCLQKIIKQQLENIISFYNKIHDYLRKLNLKFIKLEIPLEKF